MTLTHGRLSTGSAFARSRFGDAVMSCHVAAFPGDQSARVRFGNRYPMRSFRKKRADGNGTNDRRFGIVQFP